MKKTNYKKSTINKIRNTVSDLDQLREKESTVFQNKMIDVVYYLFNSLAISSKPGRLMLPKWINISEKRFNEILSTVTKAKNEGLRTYVDRREITLDNTESLLKDLSNGLEDGHEFKNRYNDIVNDVEIILKAPRLTRSQNKMLEILSLLKEIANKISYKKSDTKNMLKLEGNRSAGRGLKILTPDQMFSRLPISLIQLKAGNSSQKLKNEIRQLLYSFYRSKKLAKQLYKSLVDII